MASIEKGGRDLSEGVGWRVDEGFPKAKVEGMKR